jgi:hypothetical protein
MALDTRFRLMDDETLTALKSSCLQQIKAIEGAGQSHSMNGRNVAMANLGELYDKLANISAAITWKADQANSGGLGYASRFTDYSTPE